MSCKHPNIIIYEKNSIYLKSQNPKTEEPKGTRIHFIPSWSKHFTEYEYYINTQKDLIKDPTWQKMKESGHEVGLKLIPCKTCIGCRLQQTQEWALRIYLESKKYENNYFLTLTYDPEHLPMKEFTISEETGEIFTPESCHYNWKGTLNYEDVQGFIKRFRSYLEYHYQHKGIRFYGCGEYGSTGKRPHYHIIFMNCPDLSSIIKSMGMNKKTGHPYFYSSSIEELWGKGFVNIGKVTWDSISYTAGYCTKKLFGRTGKEIYAMNGQEPEFTKMSLRPAIGLEYFNKNWKEIYKTDSIINGKGISVKPPSYFDKKMIDIGEETILNDLKEKRQQYMQDKLNLKLKTTSKSLKNILKDEEETLIWKSNLYNRERI